MATLVVERLDAHRVKLRKEPVRWPTFSRAGHHRRTDRARRFGTVRRLGKESGIDFGAALFLFSKYSKQLTN